MSSEREWGYQDILRLRRMCKRAVNIGRSLEDDVFQHSRISLPVGEAVKAVSHLEAWLSDILLIAETELCPLKET